MKEISFSFIVVCWFYSWVVKRYVIVYQHYFFSAVNTHILSLESIFPASIFVLQHGIKAGISVLCSLIRILTKGVAVLLSPTLQIVSFISDWSSSLSSTTVAMIQLLHNWLRQFCTSSSSCQLASSFFFLNRVFHHWVSILEYLKIIIVFLIIAYFVSWFLDAWAQHLESISDSILPALERRISLLEHVVTW